MIKTRGAVFFYFINLFFYVFARLSFTKDTETLRSHLKLIFKTTLVEGPNFPWAFAYVHVFSACRQMLCVLL